MRFERRYPIRFAHCDVAGIVFFPQYFVLFNDHLEDWFNDGLAQDFGDLHVRQRLAVPTARLECDFVAPSRIGEKLDFWLEVERLGRTSVTLARGADCAGQRRVALRQVVVCVDQQTQRPRPWPDSLRERLERWQADAPGPARPPAGDADDDDADDAPHSTRSQETPLGSRPQPLAAAPHAAATPLRPAVAHRPVPGAIATAGFGPGSRPMSAHRILQPESWVKPRGYANGIAARGTTIAIAGQIGWNAQCRFETDDFAGQARQALANLLAVLADAGGLPEHIVRMTWYVTDKHEYLGAGRAVGAAYRELMRTREGGIWYPAMTAVQVAALIEDRAKVEIEATAVLPD